MRQSIDALLIAILTVVATGSRALADETQPSGDSFIALVGKNWTEISSTLQLLAAIWVASVASIALSTWKNQLRAEKQLSFLDELTDAVHEYLLMMPTPKTRLNIAKIEIEARLGIPSEYDEFENAEVIAFINDWGEETSDKLMADLVSIRPVLGKMQSLSAKGQVLGLPDYENCQNAIQMLARSYDQIEAFSAIIRNQNLNWNNPRVQESLNHVAEIDPARIDANLSEYSVEFLKFTKKAYEQVLR